MSNKTNNNPIIIRQAADSKTGAAKKSVLTDVVVINPLDDAKEGIGTTLKLVTSALTLVSALAWNDAIKYLFEELNQFIPGIAALGKFGYALIITFLTVFIINRIEKITMHFEKKKEDSAETDVDEVTTRAKKNSKKQSKKKK